MVQTKESLDHGVGPTRKTSDSNDLSQKSNLQPEQTNASVDSGVVTAVTGDREEEDSELKDKGISSNEPTINGNARERDGNSESMSKGDTTIATKQLDDNAATKLLSEKQPSGGDIDRSNSNEGALEPDGEEVEAAPKAQNDNDDDKERDNFGTDNDPHRVVDPGLIGSKESAGEFIRARSLVYSQNYRLPFAYNFFMISHSFGWFFLLVLPL